jgi:hypothetical protein
MLSLVLRMLIINLVYLKPYGKKETVVEATKCGSTNLRKSRYIV